MMMLLLTLALAIQPSSPQPRVEAIRDDFAAQMARCGRPLPKLPTMVAHTTPGMIFFDPDDTSIHYPLWAELSADARAYVTTAAAAAPGRPTPEQYFAAVFQRFLVAHELGHYLEELGKQKLSWWDSEYRANQIAVAYWRMKDGDRALEKALADQLAYENGRPGPAPAGADLPTFFNQSKFDPATYGWWQGEMTRRAWRARKSTSFCKLVRLQWPKASA